MASIRSSLIAAFAALAGAASGSPSGILVPRQVGSPPSAPSQLEVFQLAPPVPGPEGPLASWGRDRVTVASAVQKRQKESCQLLLMEHTFENSYEKPFVGEYKPPECEFNRVVLNFTATAPAGVQYDRLAIMYFGDTEVWRTSTAEPSEDASVVWTYWKDMTPYMYFWKQPQKIIFDLGNIVDDKLTSPFNAVLTATFFTADENLEGVGGDVEGGTNKDGPADLIIPVSAHKGESDLASAWEYPKQEPVDVISSFPRNARRAVFSVSANGQGQEESWYIGVPRSAMNTFPEAEFDGTDSWREVQVLIDDHLVGVYWPFPTLFTGAMMPELNRPIVGVNTFDLKEHEIDVTPWLPLLCDGEEHTVSLQVVCSDDRNANGTEVVPAPGNWILTGKIFVWLDEDEDSITTGDLPTILDGDPKKIKFEHAHKEVTVDQFGDNSSLTYGLKAYRGLLVEGRIKTQAGEKNVSWAQFLNHTASGEITGYGGNSQMEVKITGVEGASGVAEYRTEYSYPILIIGNQVIQQPQFLVYIGVTNIVLSQALDHKVWGSSVFPTGVEAYNGTFEASSLSTNRDSLYQFTVDLGTGLNYSVIYADQTLSLNGVASDDGGNVPLYERVLQSDFDMVSADMETVEGVMVEFSHPGSIYTSAQPGQFTRGQMLPGDIVKIRPESARGPWSRFGLSNIAQRKGKYSNSGI